LFPFTTLFRSPPRQTRRRSHPRGRRQPGLAPHSDTRRKPRAPLHVHHRSPRRSHHHRRRVTALGGPAVIPLMQPPLSPRACLVRRRRRHRHTPGGSRCYIPGSPTFRPTGSFLREGCATCCLFLRVTTLVLSVPRVSAPVLTRPSATHRTIAACVILWKSIGLRAQNPRPRKMRSL